MFIVIEGLDGAGKSTQVKLINQYFEDNGLQTKYLHFPRFDAPVYGEMIAKFLRGDYGDINSVDPQLVALIYAGDRAEAASMIQGWLDDGFVVVVDRYIYSNIAYQCAKTQGNEELKEWILDLEVDRNKIPQPDLTLFLDVPFKFTTAKLNEVRKGDDRDYLQGKQDIHEASLDFQANVRQEYLKLANEGRIRVINCASDAGEMAKPEQIFKLIQDEIMSVKK